MKEDLYTEVTRKAGGPSRLAELLGVAAAVVGNWKSRGFPPNKARAIEALTGVSVKRLRPDDWIEYWPELAANPARITAKRRAAKETA